MQVDIKITVLQAFLLDQLDYVNRAHEIEIVRLWHRLSLNLSHGFLFKLYLLVALAHIPRLFFALKKAFSDYLRFFFSFSLKWDPIQAKY